MVRYGGHNNTNRQLSLLPGSWSLPVLAGSFLFKIMTGGFC
jgi:hypothetical protein